MTNHLNINWAATAEINKREFNTQAKWDETYDPDNKLVKDVYSKLGNRRSIRNTEADATVAPETALRKALHRKDVVEKGGTTHSHRHHVHRKHRADCPKHLQNQIIRGERERTLTFHSASAPSPPELPALSPPHGSRFRSETAATQKSHPMGISSVGTFGCGGRASQAVGGHVAKPETHRLSNVEKERLRREREEMYLKSSSATNRSGSKVDALLANKPFQVGRSFASCVTGSYNPHNNQLRRKMEDDHPNFTERNAQVDAQYDRYKDQFSWRAQTRPEEGGDARRIGHVKTVPDKIVQDEHDTTHFRRKYDMKSYMESMRQMGANNLLRDFK